jgi:hypothetical protein
MSTAVDGGDVKSKAAQKVLRERTLSSADINGVPLIFHAGHPSLHLQIFTAVTAKKSAT